MRLIDADALKKEWSMGLGSCDDCPQNTRRCQLDMDFTRMDICGMIDDAPTVGGWISVNDRLPEKSGEYLVFIKTECITICWYDGQKWLDSDGCEWAESFVSHWAALPKPPEVGK